MKVYKNANLNKKHYSSVIAIGNFDGLHLGHQKVIREAKQKAKKNNLPFGVMTFEPVPVMFFNKYNKDHRINSLQQKWFSQHEAFLRLSCSARRPKMAQ